jgi:hypothetical protein
MIVLNLAGQRRDWRVEERYRRKDGNITWADVSVGFVPSTTGGTGNHQAKSRWISDEQWMLDE